MTAYRLFASTGTSLGVTNVQMRASAGLDNRKSHWYPAKTGLYCKRARDGEKVRPRMLESSCGI